MTEQTWQEYYTAEIQKLMKPDEIRRQIKFFRQQQAELDLLNATPYSERDDDFYLNLQATEYWLYNGSFSPGKLRDVWVECWPDLCEESQKLLMEYYGGVIDFEYYLNDVLPEIFTPDDKGANQ